MSKTVSTHVAASGDLPAYTLRLSARARHIRLTVTPRDGLVVVVPRRMKGYDPAPLLREREQWIADATAHFAQRRAALQRDPRDMLPAHIAFPATGECWDVEYRTASSTSTSARVRAAGDRLVVTAPADAPLEAIGALQRWLSASARKHLLPLLAEESARTGYGYKRAEIRGQRGRWGGCSSRGTITLNRCLLFLRPELARAVVLHELAHVPHPNHSSAFWRELARLDPNAAAHRKAIGHAWDTIPAWAEPDSATK
jgi:predicted metal-dependent hydrolase